MSELRERRPTAKGAPAVAEAEDTKKTQQPKAEVDLEPNIFVLTTLFVLFSTVVGTFLYYKIDNASQGDFAAWVNYRFPRVQQLLNQPGKWPGFGANAEEIPVPTGGLRLTEAELKAFDGTDPDQPIYLALNGTIYDVSASPSFYGPGGHYHHFVGKDATRAWVTECWDESEQFTWRLDNLEPMFYPQYLDEQLEDVVQGKWDPIASSSKFNMPKEAMMLLAKKSMERFGSVTDGEKARRRAEDKEEAEKAIAAVVERWGKFFSGSDKYQVVGSVILDENKPAPPALCQKALDKKPVKGGKLEGLMGNLSRMGHVDPTDGEDEDEDNFPEGIPEHVKAQIKKDRAAKKAAASVEDVDLTKDSAEGDAEAIRDEL